MALGSSQGLCDWLASSGAKPTSAFVRRTRKKKKEKAKQVRLLGDGNKAGCAACAVFCGLVYSLNWHNCRWAHSWDEHPLWLRGVFQPVPAKVQNDLFHSAPFPSWGGIKLPTVLSNRAVSYIWCHMSKFCLVLIEMRPRWVMWKLSSRFLFMICWVSF